MADVTFNIAKGKAAYYAELNGASDSFIVVPIEASGLEADATLVDYDSLDAILSAANNEQTTMNRATLTSVTVTVDDTNNRTAIDCDDPSWASTAGNAVGALIFCYKPASDSADSAIIPLSKHDWSYTPDGNTVTATIGASGFYWTT